MAQPSSPTITMNNTGSAASILAASQQASFSPIASSGVGGANLQAAAAPVSQGQSQQLPAIQSGMLVNAAPVFQGNIQPGQPNIQAQVQPLPVPPIVRQAVQQCGCTPDTPCSQHASTSNFNPIMKCVRFLAFWECGAIGTIITAVAFAIGTFIS